MDALGAQQDRRARRNSPASPVYEGQFEEQYLVREPVLRRLLAGRRGPRGRCRHLVDVEVPWFPAPCMPNEKSFWAHIDVDVLKPGSPMWTFPGNLRLQGDTGRILDQLLDGGEGQSDAALQGSRGGAARPLKAARDERQAQRRQARRRQGQARRHQSALSDGGAWQGARRSGHHLQRRR